jgi:hypothetical protein
MEKFYTFLDYCSKEECIAFGFLIGLVSHCLIMNCIPRLIGLI